MKSKGTLRGGRHECRPEVRATGRAFPEREGSPDLLREGCRGPPRLPATRMSHQTGLAEAEGRGWLFKLLNWLQGDLCVGLTFACESENWARRAFTDRVVQSALDR